MILPSERLWAAKEMTWASVNTVLDQEDERLRKLYQARDGDAASGDKKRKISQMSPAVSINQRGSGIGKYLTTGKVAEMAALNGLDDALEGGGTKAVPTVAGSNEAKKPQTKPKTSKFGDFSSW